MFTLDNLIIELTRKCNMECLHCLRGEQEDLKINLDYVEQIFSVIGDIYCLTFTGGEPALCGNEISKIIELAKKYNTDIGYFYIATNGTVKTKEFLFALVELYDYCYEPENCLLEISNDKYHKQEILAGGLQLQNFDCFTFAKNKYSDNRGLEDKYLLQEGRAAMNYPAIRMVEPDEEYLSVNCVYLNCKGQLINACDWSFDSQDDNILCDLENESFEQYYLDNHEEL